MLYITVLIIILFTLMYVIYAKYILKNNIVKVAGYSLMIVLTESMEPNIEGQECIIVKKCEQYNLHDIVLYKNSDGILITHRIVKINDKTFIAKGDKNNVNDKEESIDAIEGKVVYHSKLLGIFIYKYLKFFLLIYTIFVLISNCIRGAERRVCEKNKKRMCN